MPGSGFCARKRTNFISSGFFISDQIHGRPALDWSRRKRIALGTARGLLYLHEQCDPKIIHRDVKAANILLDEDFEAVVGDFGLAKLLDHRESHVTTAVRGTVGHIAPEYLSTGQSSEKTDVFGFGILLLELITGQKALDFGRAANQKGVMLDWVISFSLVSHAMMYAGMNSTRMTVPAILKNPFSFICINRTTLLATREKELKLFLDLQGYMNIFSFNHVTMKSS